MRAAPAGPGPGSRFARSRLTEEALGGALGSRRPSSGASTGERTPPSARPSSLSVTLPFFSREATLCTPRCGSQGPTSAPVTTVLPPSLPQLHVRDQPGGRAASQAAREPPCAAPRVLQQGAVTRGWGAPAQPARTPCAGQGAPPGSSRHSASRRPASACRVGCSVHHGAGPARHPSLSHLSHGMINGNGLPVAFTVIVSSKTTVQPSPPVFRSAARHRVDAQETDFQSVQRESGKTLHFHPTLVSEQGQLGSDLETHKLRC